MYTVTALIWRYITLPGQKPAFMAFIVTFFCLQGPLSSFFSLTLIITNISLNYRKVECFLSLWPNHRRKEKYIKNREDKKMCRDFSLLHYTKSERAHKTETYIQTVLSAKTKHFLSKPWPQKGLSYKICLTVEVIEYNEEN